VVTPSGTIVAQADAVTQRASVTETRHHAENRKMLKWL